MNNELAVLDGFQCARFGRLLRRRNGKNVAGRERGMKKGTEGRRASYFGLMRVDTAALFYGLLKRSSDKFSAAPGDGRSPTSSSSLVLCPNPPDIGRRGARKFGSGEGNGL